MAKEFEMYNRKYAHLAGTCLKNIETEGGKVAKEDIAIFTSWDRAALEGRVEDSRRWITIKMVNELKHMLKDCDLHSELDEGK